MKTTLKKLVLTAIVFALVSAKAVAFEDSLKVKNQKSFDLILSDVKNQTQITLIDKSKNVLFEQTLNKGENFARTFNMELLPLGEYSFEIEDALKVKNITVDIIDNESELSIAESTVIHKPVLNTKGDAVVVTQFTPTKNPLHISIFNNYNELIHEEVLKGSMDLGKKYDFSKSRGGQYRFYFETSGLSYSQDIYVEK